MADLNSLGLNDEGISEADFDNMPQSSGAGGRMPPQPGIYRFKLAPAAALFKCFEELITNDQGQKLAAVFKDEAALRNLTLNQWHDARINNRTRIQKRGDAEVIISDMGVLLKCVGSKPVAVNGVISNGAYGNALIAAADREFLGETGLSATCNEKRDIYKNGAVVVGEKGCGQRYTEKAYKPKNGNEVLAIPQEVDDTGKETGKFAMRFTCKCSAELRCFGEMRGFRPAE